jgi:5S rRNA maturation endonuclease (ribonuclease M5)
VGSALGPHFAGTRPGGQVMTAPEAVYTYADEAGDMLFQVVRRPGKKFIQRRPKNGKAFRIGWSDNGEWQAPDGWDYDLNGVRRVIYRLPQVAEAIKSGKPVWIVEGEKDADNLYTAGVVATCNPGGALKWRHDYNPTFRYANVVIVADRDAIGYKHAAEVAEHLRGIASSIRIVEAAKGKDASDHLEAGLGVDDFVPLEDDQEPGEPSSWAPVSLEDVLDGEPEPPPTICRRDDGACLFYAGKWHWLQGESETLKTWLVCYAAKEQIKLGHHVVYFDFEDSAKGVTGRLLALGCTRDEILTYFHYIQPDSPFDDGARAAIQSALTPVPTLAIFDGVTEVMTLQGWDAVGEKSNQDVVKLIRMLPKVLAKLGSAVALIDHLAKASGGKGQYAIGGQHKRNIVNGASYTFELVKPFGRGQHGIARISIAKDRPGYVREVDPNQAGILHLYSEDGKVRAELQAPTRGSQQTGRGRDDGKPVEMMVKVSELLVKTPGLSKTAIIDSIPGREATKKTAIEYLELEKYIEARPRKGKGAGNAYFNLKPYTGFTFSAGL